MAELKRDAEAGSDVGAGDLHGYEAVAELKPRGAWEPGRADW
ncbi:hypothetical protein FRUB_06444 [Fimbriiglobus ruber]|uniref:Uncharacterized protein n=1 Tax=Fimbriiglobus ruber TaxID=1908690 RepID=A0A225DCF4_9BACT|nr:hypothetical protein FRUB_06444 [Fimbriiglobus ruber]